MLIQLSSNQFLNEIFLQRRQQFLIQQDLRERADATLVKNLIGRLKLIGSDDPRLNGERSEEQVNVVVHKLRFSIATEI